MPITKKTEEIIMVLPDGRMEVSENTVYVEDGVEVARKNANTYVVDVGDDVSARPALVRDVAAGVKTQDRVNASRLARNPKGI